MNIRVDRSNALFLFSFFFFFSLFLSTRSRKLAPCVKIAVLSSPRFYLYIYERREREIHTHTHLPLTSSTSQRSNKRTSCSNNAHLYCRVRASESNAEVIEGTRRFPLIHHLQICAPHSIIKSVENDDGEKSEGGVSSLSAVRERTLSLKILLSRRG